VTAAKFPDRDKRFLFCCAGRGGMLGASLFPLTHPTIVRKHNQGALGTSRTPGERGRATRKPSAVSDEPEITRTSLSGIRELYEKYSAEGSAAIMSS
jgi:hypothetical protein